MKVKIFTEGGYNIGLGHISRCSSLYDEIVDRGIDVEFIIYGDIKNLDILKGRTVKNDNWLSVDYLKNYINDKDYCIVDSYLASKDLYEIISRKAKKSLFIDDMARINYPRGIVINPSLDIDGICYPENNVCEYLWGSDYIILRSPFINVERKDVRKTVDKVMVTMGGSDFRNLTPTIIKEICNYYSHIKFHIIITTAFSNIDEIKKASNTNIIFHYDANGDVMSELMKNSDLVITAAGQTIYELLSTKTPFIPVQIADNQSNNINSLNKLGLIINSIDYYSDSFSEELNESFALLLDYNVRKQLVSKFQNIVDGKGRDRIIKKLLDSETNSMVFRTISDSDCDLLYEWANDELVRKNAFISDKIDYENHRIWFNNKLNSENTMIYIILMNLNPIGQIRIDIDNNYGIIDYSIDSKHRGKGLGASLLKLIGNRVKNDCTTLEKLVGRVKFDNFSSQKSFERAGFRRKKEEGYFEYEIKL